MAEENFGEKTEPATPRKRQETREKGMVARSQDLNTAILLLAATLVCFFLAGYLLEGLNAISTRSIEAVGTGRLTFENVLHYGRGGLIALLLVGLPIAAAMLAVAVLVNMMQVGMTVSTEPLAPNLTRVSPWQGFRRIFSRRGLARTVFSMLKMAVVGSVLVQSFAALISRQSSAGIFSLFGASLDAAVEASNRAFLSMGIRASIALLVLALIEYFFQRWQFERDIMMTKEEMREELKRLEGDPKLKERRRRIAQRLALQRMLQDVPRADVVITNPTHVACALKYDQATMRAPRLVAKGRERMAHRIREIAIANGVPIVEEPPLARMIHDGTEVGEEIPADLYQPVAEVLAYVYRLHRKGARAAAAY